MLEQRGIYISTADLCELTGAHRTTVERWKREQRLPRAVSSLVQIAHDGQLELVHDAWRGFRLDRRSGVLWTPDDWPCRPGDIMAIRYRMAQLRALEAERDLEGPRLLGGLLKRA